MSDLKAKLGYSKVTTSTGNKLACFAFASLVGMGKLAQKEQDSP